MRLYAAAPQQLNILLHQYVTCQIWILHSKRLSSMSTKELWLKFGKDFGFVNKKNQLNTNYI